MKLEMVVGAPRSVNRRLRVQLEPAELQSVRLHVAFPAERNRNGLYMRRHRTRTDVTAGIQVGPNEPLRNAAAPPKLTIPEHLDQIRQSGALRSAPRRAASDSGESFGLLPTVFAVPVSDVVANLMRPCFCRSGLGAWRTFFFEDEPIRAKSYWAVCCFENDGAFAEIRFEQIRFDPDNDTVLGADGGDLAQKGLSWAVALIPLVQCSRPLSPVAIAQNDYDLRHFFGREAEVDINYAYDGWFEHWDERVESLVRSRASDALPFATFYHSILGIDGRGCITILQVDGELPALAEELAANGLIAAGVLDSGGSCAFYDSWLGSYLNHGWYFREPRGAVLVFELKTEERIPESSRLLKNYS